MRGLTLAVLIAGLVLMSPASYAGGLVLTRSSHSVGETLDRLETVLRNKGLRIFARIDHGAGAKGVGVDLRPTQLLLFGNPKLGSQLLTSSQLVGIDLPMKALVWEDAQGQVWLAYNDPGYVAARHGIEDRPGVISKMSGALNKLTGKATQP
ncbi:MAG: DUF302 domain-containing protein [Acidiferrobacterales bacterium]